MDYRDLSDDAVTLTNWLVAIPSVSGTKGESVIIKAIYDGLSDFNYFKKNKDLISYINHDGEKSASITALVKSTNPQVTDTIILLCNVDTSNLDKYSNFKNIAYKIEDLIPKLKKESKDSNLLNDIESNDYLFGIGVYEAKAATGSMIAALKYFTENHQTLESNVLFVCVSESINSNHGIKTVLPYIARIQESHNLNFKLCLNAKPAMAYEDPKENYIYTSHQGQVEIGLYIIGKGTNPAMPFNGFSPSLLTSVLIKNIELNPRLLESANLASVPTFNALNYKSSRLGMTPEIMQISFIFNLKGSCIDDIVEILKDTVASSLEECSELLDDRETLYATLNKEKFVSEIKEAEVLTYANLLKRAKKYYQGDLIAAIESLVYKCQSEGLTSFQTTSSIIDRLNDLCHLPRPSVVIFTGDKYIPEQSIQENNVKDRETLIHVHKALDYLTDKNSIVPKLKKHFVANDINFMRPIGIDNALKDIEKNTALNLGDFYNLNTPSITISLKGHDLYNISERIAKTQLKYINDFIFSVMEAFDKTIIDNKDKLKITHNTQNKVSDIASSIFNQTVDVINKTVDNLKALNPINKKDEDKSALSDLKESSLDKIEKKDQKEIKDSVESVETKDKVETKETDLKETQESKKEVELKEIKKDKSSLKNDDFEKVSSLDEKELTVENSLSMPKSYTQSLENEVSSILNNDVDKEESKVSKVKKHDLIDTTKSESSTSTLASNINNNLHQSSLFEDKKYNYKLDEKGFKNLDYSKSKLNSSLDNKRSDLQSLPRNSSKSPFADFKTSSESRQNDLYQSRSNYLSQNQSIATAKDRDTLNKESKANSYFANSYSNNNKDTSSFLKNETSRTFANKSYSSNLQSQLNTQTTTSTQSSYFSKTSTTTINTNRGSYINTPVSALNKSYTSSFNKDDNKISSNNSASSTESIDITHKIINTDELNKIKANAKPSYFTKDNDSKDKSDTKRKGTRIGANSSKTYDQSNKITSNVKRSSYTSKKVNTLKDK